MALATSTDEWVELARDLGPSIEAARQETARERRVSPSLLAAMVEAGLFRLKIPREYGGAEVDHVTFFRVVEELAKFDGSPAWLAAIGAEGAALAGYLPRDAAEEIYGPDPNIVVAATAVLRQGQATRAEGGYRLSGQWGIASGCPDASWVGVGVPMASEGGPPDIQIFMVPSRECQVLDTWDTLGMRGTASHDLAITDAFVAEPRRFSMVHGKSQLAGPIWRGGYRSHLGGIAAVALGVARAAIDDLAELATEKVPKGPSSTALRDRPATQARVAQAEALVRSARAFLYETLESISATQAHGNEPSPAEATLQQLAVAHAIQSSADAVDLLYDVAGATAIYNHNRLGQCFADAHVMTQHTAANLWRFETVGRFLLEQRALAADAGSNGTGPHA